MNTPLILTVLSRHKNDHQEKFGMNVSYFRALYKAGGNFLCIGRPTDQNLDRMLTMANGVLLIGGADVNPLKYHERNHFARHIDRERDRVEILLAQHAIKWKIPILGICRGMQVMNIAQGGSLHQDVHHDLPGSIRHDYHRDEEGRFRPHHLVAHKNTIFPKTKLFHIIKKRQYSVNSLHHQGIEILGKDLVASSRAPDGLIEGIEVPGHPFAIGVEWHPEEMRDTGSKALFREFVRASNNSISGWHTRVGRFVDR